MIRSALLLRSFIVGLLFFSAIGLVDAQKTIQQVDFKNFTYSLNGPKLGHDRFVWLDLARAGQITLVNGKDDSGFILESLKFADVTDGGEKDAIVTLRFNTGGTQYTHYVYIYSFSTSKVKPIAYFHSGDRAHSGLHKVYGENGKLVVELFDPKKAIADCCSSGFVRTRYQWHDNRFEAIGDREYETLKEP